MKKYLLFFFLFMLEKPVIGQIDTIKISKITFISVKETLENENRTKDTILNLYRLDNEHKTLVQKFYLYKDEGGDCNNLFWNIGKITIKNHKLIFLTHHLQKRHDPIPAARREIYQISKTGDLKLLSDKYQKQDDKNWYKTDDKGE